MDKRCLNFSSKEKNENLTFILLSVFVDDDDNEDDGNNLPLHLFNESSLFLNSHTLSHLHKITLWCLHNFIHSFSLSRIHASIYSLSLSLSLSLTHTHTHTHTHTDIFFSHNSSPLATHPKFFLFFPGMFFSQSKQLRMKIKGQR